MNRADLLQALQDGPVHDLVVIGGGATGLGVALDARLRGFSVLLAEAADFAGGTSSRSTKLLHGGVRYLAQGRIGLVREAMAERQAVLGLAPHLAQPLPFVVPAYRWWQRPYYGLGLYLYDLLAGRAGLGRTEWLDRAQTLAALPGVQPHGLRGGVRYWDGQFEDARLALALARTLERTGGRALNYMRVAGLTRLSAGAADGARFELALEDRREAASCTVRARCVVNAAGVWVDRVRQLGVPEAERPRLSRMVSPSQGAHLVVRRDFLPGRAALLVPRTQDGRVLFAVPWLGALILGTTDTPRPDLPREPQAFEAEVDFILREASRVLSRPVRRADVRSVWVGLRPLVAKAHTGGGTQDLSREHVVALDPNGLVTVTGGKWTTYRAMGEDVLARCFAAGLLPARPSADTRHHRLLGADAALPAVGLDQPPGWHLYGDQAEAVRACGGADRELGLGLTEAMVRYAVRQEYAWTVEDVLARRWRALFLDARQAREMAPAVAAVVREETGADPHLQDFVDLCGRYVL